MPMLLGSTALGGVLIFRGTASGGGETKVVGIAKPTDTSYVDTSIGQDLNIAAYSDTAANNVLPTPYYYVGRAFGGGGLSAASNEVTASVSTLAPPSNVAATLAPASGQIGIAVSATANGAAITGFEVHEGSTSGGESSTPLTTITPSSSATSGQITGSFTDTGLTDGQARYYTIIALSSAGNTTSQEYASASSSPVTASNLSPTPSVPFSTTLSGFPSGATLSSPVFSDATPATISGAVVSTGAYPIASSGLPVTLTVTVTPSGGSAYNTSLALVVATLMDVNTIPGTPVLKSWNRADSATFSGTTASAWPSKVSGGGSFVAPASANYATYSAANSALNGQPSLTGTGTTTMLANAAELATMVSEAGITNFHVGVTGAAVSTTVNGQIFYKGTVSTDATRQSITSLANSTKRQMVSRTTDAQSSSEVTLASAAMAVGTAYQGIYEFNFPAATSYLNENGTVVTGTVTSGAASPSTQPIGAALFAADGKNGTLATANNVKETLAERGEFAGILTAAQKQYLQGVHMARYALQAAFGSSHPFYSFPPTILGLTKASAAHGAAFSAQVTGLPPGATGVSVSSSNGADSLAISSGVLSGSFAAAGTSTLTLSAAYNGVAFTGLVAVTVS